MNKLCPPDFRDSTTWRVGQRVMRVNSEELGTIVEADAEVKVKWDGGRTSYFRRGAPANVQLAATEAAALSANAVDEAMDRPVGEAASTED